VTAAMIATTVEKGITVGQWAFALFDDERNDCTSLWREWKILHDLTLTTWRRDMLMSTQQKWCRSWRSELLGRKEGKSSAIDTSQTVTKLRNIPLFKVFNLIPKIFSNALQSIRTPKLKYEDGTCVEIEQPLRKMVTVAQWLLYCT